MKRAQASMEFLMLVGFMAAVFIVFYAVLSGFLADFRGEENLNITHDVLKKLGNEIDLANRAYAGYERSFELPTYLDGGAYVLALHPSTGDPITEIIINYRGKEQVLPLRASVYLDPNNSDIGKRKLMIKKTQHNSPLYVSGRMYLSFLS